MLKKIFKFCGSLQLAMLLLAGVMVMSVIGTVQESRFTAEVAKKYIYNHWFFDIWLLVLVVNLFCAAAVRYPWKPHQTGFVITHAGIIVLLIGGFIDRHWGIEGFITLDRGDAPTDIMELDVQDIAIRRAGDSAPPALHKINLKEFTGDDDLGFTVNSPDPNIKVQLLDLVPPAVKVVLAGAKMGRSEQWLFLGDNLNLGPAGFSLRKGMPPTPKEKPVEKTAEGEEKTPRLERYFIFAKHPTPIAKTIQGQPTGAKATLDMGEDKNTPVVKLELNGKSFDLNVKDYLNKRLPLEGMSDWQIYIFAYFPNFVMNEQGKPDNRDMNPDNPAVTFELQGPLVPVSDKPKDDDPHAPTGPTNDPSANNLALYLGPDGKLRYFLKSRTKGESAGEVTLGEPVLAGWAGDAAFTIERFISSEFTKARDEDNKRHAEFLKTNPGQRYISEMPSLKRLETRPMGVLLRVEAKGDKKDVWVPISTIHFPRKEFAEVGGEKLEFSLVRRAVQLPFRIALERFIAEKQPGQAQMFASFASTLSFQDKANVAKNEAIDPPLQLDFVRVKEDSIAVTQLGRERAQPPIPGDDPKVLRYRCAVIKENPQSVIVTFPDKHEVEVAKSTLVDYKKNTHNISMNRPTVYPETWYGPWLGTSYKFSQANHDDGRPDHSGLQVLRDPGWFFKWMGCLGICGGIFTMFYLKPYFNRPRAQAANASNAAGGDDKKGKKQKKSKAELSHA